MITIYVTKWFITNEDWVPLIYSESKTHATE